MMHIATALFAIYFVDKRLLISYSITLLSMFGSLDDLLFFNCAIFDKVSVKIRSN
jgi:hypothetical protein